MATTIIHVHIHYQLVLHGINIENVVMIKDSVFAFKLTIIEIDMSWLSVYQNTRPLNLISMDRCVMV